MTKLAVLGVLIRGPLHGYEIKQIIQREMGDWTNIAFGSVYFALSQLAKEGFISEENQIIQDARPAKTVYKITEKGRKEFIKLLTETWCSDDRQFFSIDLALYFFNYLDPEHIKQFLRKRIRTVRNALSYVRNHQQEEQKELPKIAGAIFSHSLYHLKAEYLWLKEVLAGMEEK